MGSSATGGRSLHHATRIISKLGMAMMLALLAVAGGRGAEAACLDDGWQASGALYRICMPTAPVKWNGDLIVFAPGYVAPGEPLAIPESQLRLGDVSMPNLLTRLGFAFITTSYAKTGLAVAEGVADVVDLVDIFEGEIGEARRVYLIGPSEGGLVTALALEKYPFIFDGGLAACAPIGSFRSQINYIGDFRVLFDYFFPDLLPGSPVDIPQSLIDGWESVYVPQISAAIVADPAAALRLLRVAGAPIDQGRPQTVLATILDVLWYNVFATNDAKAQLGGQPFDNARRLYRGSGNDLRLNLAVKRFTADKVALTELADKYETTGDIDVPIVTLHNESDPVVRFLQQRQYRRKVIANGDDNRHLNLPIDRYGHCQFRTGEALGAFAILIGKVTGARPRGLSTLRSPAGPQPR